MAGPVNTSFHVALTLVCVMICILFCDAKEISREEFLEMENYLKYINKPAVKVIETEEGGIIDCVDINKQPAFDHPALKNHTVYMEPSSIPDWINAKPSDCIEMKTLEGGCPLGTVPIKRMRIEELLKAGSVSNLMNKYGQSGSSPNQLKVTQHKYAVESMSAGQAGGVYKGTQVAINLWNPRVKTTEIFSLGQLWVTNGPYDKLNTIEAGWNVYPRLYGDSKTHLFVYWTADGYHNTGCYNLKCSGFVQVSRTIYPGMSFNTVSTYGGSQVEMTLLAFWDRGTKNWWLGYYGNNGGSVIWVGYWPGSLFNTLAQQANRVDWGGEVVGDSSRTFPEMGSGHLPSEGYRKAAYMRRIFYVDPNNVLRDIPSNFAKIESCPAIYKLKDEQGIIGPPPFRRHFFYGGPGGRCTTTETEVPIRAGDCMKDTSE